MPVTAWVSVLSLLVALLALSATIWQARHTSRLTRNAHQIQVVATVFSDIRSSQFHEHYRRVLSFPPDEALPKGFESLEGERRESAYAVSYFFEHLGVLVCHDLVPADVLIATMRTWIIRSWEALQPAINAELAARKTAYDEHMGHDFLPHFRVLVQMAIRQGSPKVTRTRRHQETQSPPPAIHIATSPPDAS